MTIFVNLYGGPGTGKSTTAAGVFNRLKTEGVKCELITEYAKDLTWEETIAKVSQPKIFGEQYQRHHRLNGKVEVAITDSPLIIQSIYADMFGYGWMSGAIILGHNQFDNIDVMLRRVKKYQPYGRVQTESEAIEIDHKMLNLVHFDLKVDGNSCGELKIFEYILEKLSKNPKAN